MTEEQLVLFLRRRYAIVGVARLVERAAGDETLKLLAVGLEDFVNALLDGPLHPQPGYDWPRLFADLALQGLAVPTGGRCMTWLAAQTQGIYHHDLLALAQGREELRLAHCTQLLSGFEPYVQWVMSWKKCDGAQAEAETRQVFRRLQCHNRKDLMKALAAGGPGVGTIRSSAGTHGLFAMQAILEGDWQEAEAHFGAAAAADPENPMWLRWRASCRFVTGGFDAAVSDMTAALRLSPADEALNLLLAEMMLDNDDAAGAAEHLKRFRRDHASAWPHLPFLLGRSSSRS